MTIPKALRDRLDIRPGQVLEFEAEGGRLLVRKATDRDPVDAVYGVLEMDRSTDKAIEALRGHPDP